MDRLVVVTADAETELARLMARDGFSEEEARGRIASQMPLAEKVKLADYVIDNSDSPGRQPPGQAVHAAPRRHQARRARAANPPPGLGQHFLADPAV
jgi:dephospho-CoA kinase